MDEFIAKFPRAGWANSDAGVVMPELKEYIVKYQDPANADGIMKIQKELDETKIVLHKTIESVLERGECECELPRTGEGGTGVQSRCGMLICVCDTGEKIDSLVAKSDGLSAQSKMFYTQAKKQNSCCVVM